MLSAHQFENSRPDGFPILEVDAAYLPPDSGPAFVPLRHTTLSGEAAGPLASLTLTQVFQFGREECGRAVEALYRFPLPGDAAVTRFTVRFGDVEIRSELRARDAAEQEYEDAKQQGKQAALAARESPDVFTLRVAGLRPDEPVTVETRYTQIASQEEGEWSLRIPLTTAPRYVRSDEADSRPAAGQPLALMRDPGHRFRLDITVQDAEEVTCRTHEIDVATGGASRRVRLRGDEVVPDRDCVIAWTPARQADGVKLSVRLHPDAKDGHTYFLAQVTPPAAAPSTKLSRECVVLVDHSGSMEGAKWESADWAVKSFLRRLEPGDTFNLGVFHSNTRWVTKAVQQATTENVSSAIAFLERSRERGGTELGVALEQALRMSRTPDMATRNILIITDAEVSDYARILRLADQEAARPERRRISVLCIDSAPNAFLATALAERGLGVSRFLTSSPDEQDITSALEQVLRIWDAPAAAGLRLEVASADVEAADRQVSAAWESGWSAVDLGDLPAAQPVWVVGRFPDGNEAETRMRLVAGPAKTLAYITANGKDAPAADAIREVFGARRILALERLVGAGLDAKQRRMHLARLGYPASNAPAADGEAPLYAENVRHDSEAALTNLIQRESLRFGIASSETAFIAVRQDGEARSEYSVAIPNALPEQWPAQFALAAGRGGAGVKVYARNPGLAPSAMMRSLRVNIASFGSAPVVDALDSGLANNMMLAEAAEQFGHAVEAFAGVPVVTGGSATLFDTTIDDSLPSRGALTSLRVEMDPVDAVLDPRIALALFVDDLAAPAVRVTIADLLRNGGVRPLNLTRRGGVVRLVLEDPGGVWATGAPHLTVRLIY
jgi:Ca-activated chloride channel family protein